MISVITLTYNRARLIGETIRSVLGQSETDFEYLVVDDGSEDDTAAVVSGFSDARLRYLRLPHTGRLSSLRNTALHQSQGAFIAWIDSDDLWEPDHLRRQLDTLRDDPQAGYVFTATTLFGPEGAERRTAYAGRYRRETIRVFPELVANRLAIFPSSLMFRRSCLESTGFMNETMTGGDADFMLRLASHCRGRFVSEYLTRIRMHPGNHSLSHAAEAHLECRASLRSLRARRAIGFFIYRKVAAFHLRAAAGHFLQEGKRQPAWQLILQSLALNPLAWRTYLVLFGGWGGNRKTSSVGE